MATKELIRVDARALPAGAVAVRPGGLLAGVRRPCPDHGADCSCVARAENGQLLFWCGFGEHHVTAHH
jgi:hypothetical protein